MGTPTFRSVNVLLNLIGLNPIAPLILCCFSPFIALQHGDIFWEIVLTNIHNSNHFSLFYPTSGFPLFHPDKIPYHFPNFCKPKLQFSQPIVLTFLWSLSNIFITFNINIFRHHIQSTIKSMNTYYVLHFHNI